MRLMDESQAWQSIADALGAEMEHGSVQRSEMLSEGFLLDPGADHHLRGAVVLLRLRLWAVSV